jgi:hypothetical protein
LKIKYYDQLKEIVEYLVNNSLDYRINDIFKDYGIAKLVKISRKKVEEQGIAKLRSNSIIKEPFDNFPENKIIL